MTTVDPTLDIKIMAIIVATLVIAIIATIAFWLYPHYKLTRKKEAFEKRKQNENK
tara:strand:+ start:323 stop:487 length:165 start_codon:yes stop_codon:yes gene_type:complete